MAMWSVTVFNTTPEGCEALRQQGLEAFRASIVGSWEVTHEGPRWIQALVTQGKAQQVRSDWFPSRYLVPAGQVQPLPLWDWVRAHQEQGFLATLAENDKELAREREYGRMQVHQFHPERLQASASDAVWTVEIWDMH